MLKAVNPVRNSFFKELAMYGRHSNRVLHVLLNLPRKRQKVLHDPPKGRGFLSNGVKIINVMVFCTWVALISILLYKNYTGAPLEKTQILKGAFDKKTYWYDIYKGAEKIGFAETTFEKAGNEIMIKHKREMKVKKNEEETLLIEKLKCLSDLYYSIKSFEYTSNVKGEKGFKVSGEVDEGSIIFFLESPEK